MMYPKIPGLEVFVKRIVHQLSEMCWPSKTNFEKSLIGTQII